MSGILSQAEIDALLNKDTKTTEITDEEIDTLGEIGNISMGTAATTLYEILGKRVDITTPKVSITTMKKMAETYTIPYVGIEVKYTKGFEGYTFLVLKKIDALIITDLLMGGDGKNPGDTLDEIRLSALAEIMNQMIGSSATSLSELLGSEVNIAPPKIFEVDFETGEFKNICQDDEIAKISFKMVVEDVINSEIMQILPSEYAKKFASKLLSDSAETIASLNKIETEEVNMAPKRTEQKQESNKKVSVKPLDLQSFNEKNSDVHIEQESAQNVDLLLDVPLPISIELGRSKKMIKEILELSEGSVVVLDRFAGDLVDVVVNGKLIAKGEVVIVDENYGVRITDIISPEYNLKKGRN